MRGGDEKVEAVKVGLLGFGREIEGLKKKVEGRREEVERLVEERRRVRREVMVGRGLLEVDRKVGELEARLMLVQDQKLEDDGGSDSEEESGEDEDGAIAVSKLQRHVQEYVCIKRLVGRIGPHHQFLVKQEERILSLKQTVLLDLSSALKQAVAAGDEGKDALLKILGVYKVMDEPREAIAVLKEVKSPKS